MLPLPTERPKFAAVLAQLGEAVEELLLSGLTGPRQTSQR